MKSVPIRIEEMKRSVVRFSKQVAANTSGSWMYRIRQACTIEKLQVRFYSGPELALQIKPYLMKTKERRYEIVDYPSDTKAYIDGDNDEFEYKVSIPCDVDDEITVEFSNTSLVNAYDVIVAFELDFMWGAMRAPGGDA